jgi:hypothetical protein
MPGGAPATGPAKTRQPGPVPIAACYDNLLSGQVRGLHAEIGAPLPSPHRVALGLVPGQGAEGVVTAAATVGITCALA